MKLYLFVITAAFLVVSAVNILFDIAVWYNVLIAVFLSMVIQFLLDGLVAITINKMPDKLFCAFNPLYKVSYAEKKLYKKIRVRTWKDKVLELGALGGFSKKRLQAPDSPEYIEKFIVECNKGVATHRLSYPIGFLPMLFVPKRYAFWVVFPVALVNLFLNILPTLVLRYNTPQLCAVLKRLKRKREQRAEEEALC